MEHLVKEINMAGKYVGIDPIKLKNGRTIKTNDIIESMSEAEAKARIGFEPINNTKSEPKKIIKKDKDDE